MAKTFYYLLIASAAQGLRRPLRRPTAFYYLLIASRLLKQHNNAYYAHDFLLSLDCFPPPPNRADGRAGYAPFYYLLIASGSSTSTSPAADRLRSFYYLLIASHHVNGFGEALAREPLLSTIS